MKYKKERLFLQVLHPLLLKDLLSFTFWNEHEKQLIKYMYLENKSIDNIVVNKLMPYERSWLFEIYKSGLFKLKKWLENTEKIEYKRIFKNLI